MSNAKQSAEYEYSAEYKAEIEAMRKAEIRAAQEKVTWAAVERMKGKLAAPEVEAYIDALHEYVRLLENIIAFGPNIGEDIFN